MTPTLWPTALAAFLASLVEFVEALTIVLAVGAVRGWRAAWAGTVAAAALLAVLIFAFGPKLASLNVPLFQIIVGTLLLLFGLRWLQKAMLRAGGVVALHDEAKIYERETAALRSPTPAIRTGDSESGMATPPSEGRVKKELSAPPSLRGLASERGKGAGGLGQSALDLPAAATAFNGVFIEGIEVIFIVLAVGAAGGHAKLTAAVLGASVAAVLVVALGFAARKPLTQVPENALKLLVGALVSAFGTFWVGEGLGFHWPGGDWAAVLLSVGYGLTAWAGTLAVKRVTA